MMRGEDLQTLIEKTQTLADDASSDHLYVGDGVWPASGSLGVLYGADDEIAPNAVEALCFTATQGIVGHRANGGIGRGVIAFRWGDEGLEASWTFWTSAAQAFDAVRQVA